MIFTKGEPVTEHEDRLLMFKSPPMLLKNSCFYLKAS